MISRSSVLLLCFALLFLSSFCSAAPSDRVLVGNGTAEDPFRIRNVEDLQLMTDSKYLHAYFVLTDDIELMSDRQYDLNIKMNNNGGWEPVGFSDSAAFSGIFDGQNYTISNLYSAGPDSSGGLFHIIQNASIKNLNFENVYIQTYSEKWPSITEDDFFENFSAGTLANEIQSDITFENIKIEGTVIGKSNVGGFAGLYTYRNSSGVKIENCSFNGTVEGNSDVGGFIGSGSIIEISNSTVSGAVRSNLLDGGSSFGGFVGYLGGNSLLQNVFCDADVSGNFYAGGLAGITSRSQILNGTFNGNVTGVGQTGGLVGKFSSNSTISKSSFTGTVSGVRNVGGLVGECGQYVSSNVTNLIQESYATGNISGTEDVGGLVGGLIYGAVSDSYFTGNVSAKGNSSGGLVGLLMSANISNCYAAGTVHASKNAGGLIGFYTFDPFVDPENETASIISNTFALNEKVTAKSDAGSIIGIIDTENKSTLTAEVINVYAWDQMAVTLLSRQNASVLGENISSAEIWNKSVGSAPWENFSRSVWQDGSSSYPLPVLSWQELPDFNIDYLTPNAENVSNSDSGDKNKPNTKNLFIIILSAAVVICFSVFLFHILRKKHEINK